jgi:hypothetical protein
MLQRTTMTTSSVGCRAFLHGFRGLHGGGAARLRPTQLTTLEVVCGMARVGNDFLDGRCGACDIVGTSLSGVWRVSRSLIIVIVVVVDRVGVNDGVGAVLRERGRLWWILTTDGCDSWSELLVVVWWSWFECRQRDGDRS